MIHSHLNPRFARPALALLAVVPLLLPSLAHAYVGPGAGLSAIGSLLALLLAVVVSIAGFFWYPIKRLIKGRQGPTLEEDLATTDEQSNNTQRKS